MATIDKLNYLNETKSQIKDALNDLGAEITNDTTFRSYVTKINDLYDEYPTEQQVLALQNIQLQNIQPLEQPQIIEEPLEEVQEEQLEETQEETTLNEEEVE